MVEARRALDKSIVLINMKVGNSVTLDKVYLFTVRNLDLAGLWKIPLSNMPWDHLDHV
jgi:hypothetical protein